MREFGLLGEDRTDPASKLKRDQYNEGPNEINLVRKIPINKGGGFPVSSTQTQDFTGVEPKTIYNKMKKGLLKTQKRGNVKSTTYF